MPDESVWYLFMLCVCVRVPVYMSDDFKLTYRVSPYVERSLLYLLDLFQHSYGRASGAKPRL